MTENTTPQHNPDRHSPDYEFRPFPGDQPAPKKKAWFTKPLVWLPVGALLLGLGVGSAGQPAAAEPVTVTKEVPGPERIVEKRVEVKVPVTPAVCIEALDLAGAGISLLAEIPEHASAGIRAAGTGDVAGLNAVTRKMEALNTKITAATGPLGAAAQSCRSSAE